MKLKRLVAETIGYGNALKLKYFFSKPKPKEIIIDICAACNAKCPFCPRVYMPEERSKGYMSLELFESTLIEAKRNGISLLRLYSTAEPTLHPEFDTIIALAKSMNFYIAVSTNGSFIDKHIESLMQVDLLQYSIEGWDKESYEKYRFPLKFEKVYNNVQLFYKERQYRGGGPKITTNLLLTKKTEISPYMELWCNFIDFVNINFMLEAVIYEDNKFISKKADSICDEYYTFEPQTNNFICGYPFNVLTVAFDGKIALCCNDFSAEMNIGHISEGIKKVFNSDQINTAREEFYQQQLNICAGCSIFKQPRTEDIQNIQRILLELNPSWLEKINFQK